MVEVEGTKQSTVAKSRVSPTTNVCLAGDIFFLYHTHVCCTRVLPPRLGHGTGHRYELLSRLSHVTVLCWVRVRSIVDRVVTVLAQQGGCWVDHKVRGDPLNLCKGFL